MLLTMHSGIIAAIATVFARHTGTFVELGTWEGRGIKSPSSGSSRR